MKAALVDRPDVLTVREIPDPRPGEYDALCQLLYGATCTGTDSHIIRGKFPFPIEYPVILGHESVGRVVEVGKKVKNYRVGDLVTRVGAPPASDGSYGVAWGGFAELGLAKDHWAMQADGLSEAQWAAARVNQVLPPSVDPRVAPLFTTWRETLSYLTRMGVGLSSRVLVVGTGGNGLSFAALAARIGVGCLWVVGSTRREAQVRAIGATGFLDYRGQDCPEKLRSSCPAGFDTIVDAVGKRGQGDRFLPLLADRGKIGIYGLDDFAGVSLSPRLARGSFTVWNGGYDEAETHQRVSELFLQGKLNARLWYDLENPFPLSRITDAFRHLWEKKAVKSLVSLQS